MRVFLSRFRDESYRNMTKAGCRTQLLSKVRLPQAYEVEAGLEVQGHPSYMVCWHLGKKKGRGRELGREHRVVVML